LDLAGKSLLGYQVASSSSPTFTATDPATGETLPGTFTSATPADVDRAVTLARSAFEKPASGKQRARFLRQIADALDANGEEITARANRETAIALDRSRGELVRTTTQLRLFASLAEEGSWVNARIDPALPDRKPRRPDIRSVLRPIGPVAVFGASNFPLAFSVPGGDTASALAAGNPVIVKAHPAHPGTSELCGRIIADALRRAGAPEGLFSLLFDSGIDVGRALVQHPGIKAVAFTGSLRGGRALLDLAAARHEPIPVFAEMGSTNPVFILPGALRTKGEQIATGLQASFTIGVGQFCTKPGLVFVEAGPEGTTLVDRMSDLVKKSAGGTLLTSGIASSYRAGIAARQKKISASATSPEQPAAASAVLFETEYESFSRDPELAEELFGPTATVVRCSDHAQMLEFAKNMHGHLTATIHGTDEDLREHADLVNILQSKVGRLVFNGFPTGVEVSHAMVHGGPYPATSDSRFTSVGTLAVYRFARPVCYQNFPDASLPEELQDANPLNIVRWVDGNPTRDAVSRA
jgi:NADP-dependent aldehyde dehydrogenase